MRKPSTALLSLHTALLLALYFLPAAMRAADLSCYRKFCLGANVSVIAHEVGSNAAKANTIHSRPALIQQLVWDPQPLGPSPGTESAREVVFNFYNGELYQIAITYDRYRTEGLTAEDMTAAVSARYGPARQPTPVAKPVQSSYADEERVVTTWEDPQHRFELVRLSYGPGFKLVGTLKRLEQPAKSAILEAARLDREEAPAREAERAVLQERAERAKLEKAREANKPAFRP